MKKNYRNLRFFAVFSVVIMVAVAFHPAINPVWDHLFSEENEYLLSLVDTVKASDHSTQIYPTANQTKLFNLVQELNASTPEDNQTDLDNDGLYDSIELVIGTDLNNSDSDFDGLSDYDEVMIYLTDPRKIDSNNDGITDYFEVNSCSDNLDVDNDGIENAWDNDNDNDSVPDSVDMSPFSCSVVNSTFHFDIETTGNPTYIDFQVTPSNSNYLKLAQQTWDWPYDDEGSMIDLDDSKDDVTISPTLEVTIPTDFIITVKHSQKCLGVEEGGDNVEQISYNESNQERWKLDFFDEGYYKIISEKTKKCLEVFNESTEDEANVRQANFSIKDSQLWRLEPISDGYYNLINKHSGKCLEVANENISDGANIQQNEYWGLDNQLWKIEPVGTFIPSLEDMIDYGILVDLNTLSIPLSPVYDYGTPVALKGRMFYPATNDTTINFDTELVWKVSGNTDKKVDILQQISTGFNISVQDNNTISLSDTESSDPEKFEIKDLGSDMVALGTYNGLFITVKDSNKSELVANSSSIDGQEMFSLVDLGNDNIALKAWNGNYVSTDESGVLCAVSSSIESDETFKVIDAGYTSNLITLSRYKENFRFTGFSVQENHGSDVGLFYSKNKSQTLAASFFMAYQFLRNSSNSLTNMNQTISQQTNVSVNSTMVTDINHMDLAILEVTSKMTPTVLEDLDNQTDADESILPIIIAMEDNSTVYSMDEYNCGLFTSDIFSLDLSTVSKATTKFFKVGWYNVSSKEVLSADEFLNDIKTWGLEEGHNESRIDALMSLALVWNVGESRVIDPSSETPSSTPDNDLVLEKIQSFGLFPLTSLLDLAELVISVRASYQFLKTTLGKTGSALKGVQAYYKIMNTAKATNTFKYIGKVSKVLLVIDVVISLVIGLYSWFSFADDHGWSDFGVYVGWLSYMVIMNWAGLYLALAFAGPVGVLLAIILAIFDIIFGIGEKIMGWIIDLFTKVEQRSKIDVDLLGSPLVFIDDIEDNGVDSGDILNYKCRVAGNVTRTSDGSWGDVTQSYIRPYLSFNVPANTNWESSKDLTKTVSKYPNYRLEEYELSAWAELQNMVNFPITIKLTYDYKIYYDECFWFFGWHCDRESTTDNSVNELTTLHFDVMPETLDDFLLWGELRSNDIDGDRLLNENESSYKSSSWNYDSDGDGLWDGFEVDRGTLPNKFDSDNDGLADKIELQIHTDPLHVDTDNDGLTDYEEWKGWPVKFNYFGESFTMNESSDPLKNDTDGDGLLDIVECLKRLNPRSNDTNGNGISDYHEIVFPSYSLITEVSFNEGGNSIRIAPNETINTTIDYRLLGAINQNNMQPDNCSLMVYLEGSNVTQEIYNGAPTVGLITNHSTSFIINNTLNSSIENDTYLLDNGTYIMYYYINWNYTGILPVETEREIIGFIDINASEGPITWDCDEQGIDSDGDGLIDKNELIGWTITYTNKTGIQNITVTSDLHAVDTDGDGLSDYDESKCQFATNPRAVDTDGDGLSDSVEILLSTDPLNFDTDGDGLDDSTERSFGSDPKNLDTDGDGLNDFLEFQYSSNPNRVDTDFDGLTDYEEHNGFTDEYGTLFNSSLLLPDTDGDSLFDKLEYNLTTDPRNPDTDNDSLLDGEEYFLGTNPKKNDTDEDGLNDAEELYWRTDPLLNDTDNDSLWDGAELSYGTHPLLKDTDFDNITDFEDADTYAPHVKNIVIAYDADKGVTEFIDNLDIYTNTTIVSAEDLRSNKTYSNASNIILIGKPKKVNGTVGNITYTVLNESGKNVSNTLNSNANRFAVEYGFWNDNQTIVMISQPVFSDHWITLNIFKAKRQTMTNNSVTVEYPTPRNSFYVEAIEHIDTTIKVNLEKSAKPQVTMTLYNSSTTPSSLTKALGLGANQASLGKYIQINVSENIQNETDDIIDEAWIIIHYTLSDLDKNGDGDANDVGDIKEKSLSFYYFDEQTGKWIKVTEKLDWVMDTGVDTTNVELYGKQYEGYIWVKVNHFSLYAIAGSPIIPPSSDDKGTPARIGPGLVADASASDKFGFTGMEMNFDASLSSGDKPINSYQWDFNDGTSGEGKVTTHTFDEPGLYEVVLTITDDSGNTDTDVIYVSISVGNNPPTKPVILGNISGKMNVEYTFTAISTDADTGDMIRYGWDWNNDNIVDEWTDFIEPGNTSWINHTFSTDGFYRIKVVAEDTTHARSEWSNRFLVFIDIDYQKQDDGSYLIDDEKDGTWDAKYDPTTDELSFFSEESSMAILVLVIVFLTIIGLLFFLYVEKKKKSS